MIFSYAVWCFLVLGSDIFYLAFSLFGINHPFLACSWVRAVWAMIVGNILVLGCVLYKLPARRKRGSCAGSRAFA